MSRRSLTHIANYLSGRPLFMLPQAAKAMLDAIGPRLIGMDLDVSAAEPKQAETEKLNRLCSLYEATRVDVDGFSEYFLTPDGVAVVPLYGSLTNHHSWLNALCGFSSYSALTLTACRLADDPTVKAVLIDAESPGGEGPGMLDCADVWRGLGQDKTLWASANTLAASAAFGIITAARRITVPRLGSVGSVGVVGIHIDESALDQAEGLRFTAIYSGAHKIDGWGHAPLGEQAMARFQSEFDESRRKFAETVGRHRGMSTSAVMQTEAATFDDSAAVKAGFADAVMSFDDTLAELTEKTRKGSASFSVGAKADNGWDKTFEQLRGAPLKPAAEIGNGWDAVVARINETKKS